VDHGHSARTDYAEVPLLSKPSAPAFSALCHLKIRLLTKMATVLDTVKFLAIPPFVSIGKLPPLSLIFSEGLDEL
jgi:hypothetical protein